MIELNIKCDECGKAMDELDTLFCEKCYIAVQEKLLLEITELKDEKDGLKKEIEKLEKKK